MEMLPSPIEPDAVVLAVGSGMYPERHALQVRVSMNAARELAADLEAAGVGVGPVPMASADPGQLAVFAALTGGSLTGVAAVMRAFLNRHQHRAVVFEQNGARYEVKGMSKKDTDAMLDRLLSEAMERQIESDRLWDEVMPPREAPSADDDADAQ